MAIDFDILSWSKSNKGKYLILTRVAWDILDFLTSIVPYELTFSTESAFNTGGRIIHYYRSRMIMDTLEALICTQ